jgi:rfaE bifunctional protein kinase chain/domain
MTSARFREITSRFSDLRVAVVGDFCLDRYLEIDPQLAETSIETGLLVHNVVRVRAQPGAAGTIVNNLVALGIGQIIPVGVVGEDGEGYELRRALSGLRGIALDHLIQTSQRRTFTYCKPLIVEADKPPRELNRLDSKNWAPTPPWLQDAIASAIGRIIASVDALVLMDQVDIAETGVVTKRIQTAVVDQIADHPKLVVLADCRRGLKDYPPLGCKMNSAELAAISGAAPPLSVDTARQHASALAMRNRHPVFVTLADLGIVGVSADGAVEHVPAIPVHGPIDVVGAGDSVTAALTAALSAGANLREAMLIAMAAASIVINQLGTTGTATVKQIADCGFR